MDNQTQQPVTLKPKKKRGGLTALAGAAGVIILIVIIAVGANSCKGSSKTWTAGNYKVGTDIPAGEYVLIATSTTLSYLEVDRDSTGDIDSTIVGNDDVHNRSYVTVTNGQYLKITACKMYTLADAPKVDKSKGTLPSGMYKVGVDIPAGVYSISADKGSISTYGEVAKNSTHSNDSIVSNDYFTGTKHVTVANGQYLKLEFATLKLN